MVKRFIDVFLGVLALIVVGPVLLLVSGAVVIALGRPALFSQQRPGRGGKTFRLYKFRSMRPVDVDKGWITNADRMTRFGRVIRSTSIDELPSLWNILRGDMSIVGPRPLRVSYLERYSPTQARRHEVRPGLTGLAQISGRNGIDWDARLDLDVQYVDSRSLALDVRIILATIKAVFVREGISGEGDATMTEFFGPEVTARIRLAQLREEDLPTRVEWLSDDRVRSGISITFQPDIDGMREWYRRASDDVDRDDWVGIDRISGRAVSMCGIRRTGSDSAELYIYVAPDLHGHGYGADTMRLLVTQARRAGVALLELETPANNSIARHMYERLGFETVGTAAGGEKISMRKAIRSGHGDG
nr:GNAT family N-acetyltransferase [Microbacterium sp. MAH-37]